MGKIIQPLGSIDKNLSKQGIIELAEDHTVQIVEKGYDLLKVYVELKRYQLYLDHIINELKKEAIEVAKAQGKKSFDYSNAKVQVQRRTKYNYGQDEKWVSLNVELERLKQIKKGREALLKSITEDVMEVVNEDTGEVETLVAPTKKTLDQIVVRL